MSRGMMQLRHQYSQLRIHARALGSLQTPKINDLPKKSIRNKNYFSTGISVNNLPKVTCVNNAIQSSGDNTLEAVTNYLYKCESDNVVKRVEELENRMFKLVRETYPWAIAESPTMLCLQSLISNDCRRLFREVVESDTMKILLDQINTNIFNFSNRDLVTITRALVRLQVTPSNEVLVALTSQCIDRCSTFDLDCLHELSTAVNHFGRSGFFLMGLIVNNFSKIINNSHKNPENYNRIAKVLGNVDYFCSADMIRGIISSFSNGGQLIFLESELENIDVESSLIILEAFSRFGKMNHSTNGKLTAPLIWHIEKYIDKLSLRNLAKFWLNITLARIRTNGLINIINGRAEKYLNSNELTPAEVVSLTAIFSDKKEKNQILETLMIKNMHNFDALTLSQLSWQKPLLRTENPQLITLYSNQVLKCLSDMGNSLSCLQRVVHAFSKLKTYPVELDKILAIRCLEKLEEFVPIQSSQIFSTFLLRRSLNCGHIPTALLNVLNTQLINFTTDGLLIVKEALETSKYYLKFPNNILKLVRNLLIEKLRSSSNLRVLNLILSKSTSSTLSNYCPEIIESIAEKYLEFVSQINSSNLKVTSCNIREFKIYLPELLEKLVEVSIREIDFITANEFFDVIRTLSVLDYVPNDIEKIGNIFINFVSNSNQRDVNISDLIASLLSLSMLGFYPERMLLEVFSVEFLRKVDLFCKGANGNQAKKLQKMLAILNRSIILHQPHLNIPWFSEDFWKYLHLDSKVRQSLGKWKFDVEKQLISIFGTQNGIRKNVNSDYYHHFDFELHLDHENNLISKDLDIWTTKKKIAILILTPSYFCSNVQHLIGSVTSLINELEILEYKVVTIPYYDLDSMHLCDKSNLRSYLKQKIFGEKTFL